MHIHNHTHTQKKKITSLSVLTQARQGHSPTQTCSPQIFKNLGRVSNTLSNTIYALEKWLCIYMTAARKLGLLHILEKVTVDCKCTSFSPSLLGINRL